mmetsp:Transcript_78018/g.211008  ORF Transcript_78018/g.211008 Transcript_78018/m.211008 type:complete len:246 (+) Transcript_78018:253-990(+)
MSLAISRRWVENRLLAHDWGSHAAGPPSPGRSRGRICTSHSGRRRRGVLRDSTGLPRLRGRRRRRPHFRRLLEGICGCGSELARGLRHASLDVGHYSGSPLLLRAGSLLHGRPDVVQLGRARDAPDGTLHLAQLRADVSDALRQAPLARGASTLRAVLAVELGHAFLQVLQPQRIAGGLWLQGILRRCAAAHLRIRLLGRVVWRHPGAALLCLRLSQLLLPGLKTLLEFRSECFLQSRGCRMHIG